MCSGSKTGISYACKERKQIPIHSEERNVFQGRSAPKTSAKMYFGIAIANTGADLENFRRENAEPVGKMAISTKPGKKDLDGIVPGKHTKASKV